MSEKIVFIGSKGKVEIVGGLVNGRPAPPDFLGALRQYITARGRLAVVESEYQQKIARLQEKIQHLREQMKQEKETLEKKIQEALEQYPQFSRIQEAERVTPAMRVGFGLEGGFYHRTRVVRKKGDETPEELTEVLELI